MEISHNVLQMQCGLTAPLSIVAYSLQQDCTTKKVTDIINPLALEFSLKF
jgi:hypothetical protein